MTFNEKTLDFPGKKWTFITAFTCGTPYEDESHNLRRSCRQTGSPLILYSMKTRGSWLRNIRATNEVILHALESHHDRNIVWIDSDSRVYQYPQIFDTIEADIALFMPIVSKGARCWREYATGTMFFQNNRKVRDFWKSYIEKVDIECPDTPAQHFLGQLMESDVKLHLAPLPHCYCYIADPQPMHGELDKSEIVIHHRRGMKRYSPTGFKGEI